MKKVLIIDFGGQTVQLIAKILRKKHVYCEVFSWKSGYEKIQAFHPDALILSGGNDSVYRHDSPFVDKRVYEMGVPVLGICYGMHYTAHALGGSVAKGKVAEFGKTEIQAKNCALFEGLPPKFDVWMSHFDAAGALPEGFETIAYSKDCPVAAFQNEKRGVYGVQFHPEVHGCEHGEDIIGNFLKIAKIEGDFLLGGFIEKAIEDIHVKAAGGKVLCAFSGGVDSSVAAMLAHRAVGDNLTCVFVDHGFMRKNEPKEIEKIFSGQMGINLISVDAEKHFLDKLAGISDPEQKRKIIGAEFIRVFEAEAKKLGKIDNLVQGTIYPDVIESGSGSGEVIKSHHNVGGLPSVMDFKGVIEPLRYLFKDEVRKVGLELGLPESVVNRQPFPGPGLAVRVLGELTKERLDVLRDADDIFREELDAAGLLNSVWQSFAVLTPVRSVGVMGDRRTYANMIALRAINSVDGMTADWARIPYEVLDKVSRRITNECDGINRVVYDITGKPPATIEWE